MSSSDLCTVGSQHPLPLPSLPLTWGTGTLPANRTDAPGRHRAWQSSLAEKFRVLFSTQRQAEIDPARTGLFRLRPSSGGCRSCGGWNVWLTGDTNASGHPPRWLVLPPPPRGLNSSTVSGGSCVPKDPACTSASFTALPPVVRLCLPQVDEVRPVKGLSSFISARKLPGQTGVL